MALLQRLMKPREGERVEIYKNGRILIRGLVTVANNNLICIMDTKDMRSLNFKTSELEVAIAQREIRIKKLKN